MSKLITKRKLPGYDMLKSFQKGGAVTSKEEQQSPVELIYVLHNLIKETKDQPKSGSKEDIIEFITNHDSESEILSEEFQAKVSTPEGVEELQSDAEFMAFYNQLMPNEEAQAQYAAKGAKLKMLKSQKTTPNKEVTKAISNPVLTKATGGKANIVEPKPKPTVLSGPTIIGKKKPTVVAVAPKKDTKPAEKYATSTPIKSRSDLVGPAGKEVFQSTGKYKTVTPTATPVTPTATKGKEGGKVVPTKDKVKLIKKGSSKKCTCGCELIKSKAAGGKVIETCACKCGGKMKKKPMKKK